MKLQTQERTVIRSGVFAETNFRIAATSKAFDILSSKLYTDPRLAIVRELSTNAFDAQVEAGTSATPFKVHLPNMLEPYFLIRDYGTGISPENMVTVYSTYFESTRSDSDDFVGALGLGSKSPFSYTDQFTVTTYWNGKEYCYSAFKNERGEPSITLLSEDDTDQPNGLEVRININEGDAADFIDAAKKVYRFFPVRPMIHGAKIDFPQNPPVFENQHYQVYDESSVVDNQISIVMGNVLYPVDTEQLKHRLGRCAHVVLFMPIGTCEVAASREELHYDKDGKTIKAIQQRLNAVMTDIDEKIKAELAQDMCLFDRAKRVCQYNSIIDLRGVVKNIPLTVDKAYTLKRVRLKGDKLFIGDDRYDSYLQLSTQAKYTFIEDDTFADPMKQIDKSRLRHWMRSTAQGYVYLAKVTDRKVYTETFGANSTIYLSTLPDAPRNVVTRTGVAINKTFIKVTSKDQHLPYRDRMSDYWVNYEPSNTQTNVVAVPRKLFVALLKGGECHPRNVREIAWALGYDHIYGIAEAYYEKIRTKLCLPDLETEAEKYAQKEADKLTEYDLAHMEHGPNDCCSLPQEWLKGQSDICNDYIATKHAKGASDTVNKLIGLFKIKLPKATNYMEVFRKAYPLIAKADRYYVKKEDVVEYIQLKEMAK